MDGDTEDTLLPDRAAQQGHRRGEAPARHGGRPDHLEQGQAGTARMTNQIRGCEVILCHRFAPRVQDPPAPKVRKSPKLTPDRRPILALLYSAVRGQGRPGFFAVPWARPLAGPRFSSGSAVWLSQHGIRRMERHNLTRVLIAHGTIGTRAKANSPHPSSREGHRSAGGGTQCPIRQRLAAPPSSNGIQCRRSTCDA